MPQTSVNIRRDKELKEQAETLFAQLGMNMTTAFNVFVRQAVRTGGIPFDITIRTDDFYNETNQQHLRRAMARMKAGKGVEHELIEENNS